MATLFRIVPAIGSLLVPCRFHVPPTPPPLPPPPIGLFDPGYRQLLEVILEGLAIHLSQGSQRILEDINK